VRFAIGEKVDRHAAHTLQRRFWFQRPGVTVKQKNGTTGSAIR